MSLFQGGITFREFCLKYNLTGHERKLVRLHLIALRLEQLLKDTLA